MKYYELVLQKNGEEQTYYLRLTSSNSVALEQKCGGKSILDLVQDVSITNVCKILEYMGKDKDHNFGPKEAYELYDLLVDNGFTLFEIVYKVIYEVLAFSGFLSKKELEELVNGVMKSRQQLKNEVLEIL